jgi:hypothetical protein
MTLIQKFDAVLKVLYDISGSRPTFGRVLALLRKRKQNIHWGEVWDIFIKMRKDGILHPEVGAIYRNRMEILNLISFEGKIMYETRGLKGKMRRENITKRWAATLSILTLIIAGLSFYFSFSSVSDSTLNKVNETLEKAQLQQERMIILEQQIADDIRTISLDTSTKKVNVISKNQSLKYH